MQYSLLRQNYAKLISNYLFLVSEVIFVLLADKSLEYFLILCVGNVLCNIRFQHPTVLQTEHRDYTLLRDKRDQSCIYYSSLTFSLCVNSRLCMDKAVLSVEL
jgi:Na+/melibiose symporter-like transporter